LSYEIGFSWSVVISFVATWHNHLSMSGVLLSPAIAACLIAYNAAGRKVASPTILPYIDKGVGG
jgi:hypothetical protein